MVRKVAVLTKEELVEAAVEVEEAEEVVGLPAVEAEIQSVEFLVNKVIHKLVRTAEHKAAEEVEEEAVAKVVVAEVVVEALAEQVVVEVASTAELKVEICNGLCMLGDRPEYKDQ